MISEDVIQIQLDNIKRTIRYNYWYLSIIIIVKVVLGVFAIFNKEFQISYDTYALWDILSVCAILSVFKELIKLCDVILRISERTSNTSENKEN